jgi:hypothetical protein
MVASSVDLSSLKHSFVTNRAKPALDFTPNFAVLHLTEGCKRSELAGLEAGRKIEDIITGAAWSGASGFKLKAGAKADDFEYGYAQTALFGTFFATYAGEKPALGSISVELGLDATTLPDGSTTHRPWSAPRASDREKHAADGTIACPHQDHPNLVFPLTMINKNPDFKGSNAIKNHLHSVKYVLSFHALLCERKKTGHDLEPIAGFRWATTWNFELKYRQGKPIIVQNASSRSFDTIVSGPSLNADEALALPKISGPLFNPEVNARLKQAFRDDTSTLKRFDSTWFLSIPKDFFT